MAATPGAKLTIYAAGPAGLGCSALLPLMISFGQERLITISASVAGGVIACYQLGYGIAAFGVGPLRTAGFTPPEIYGVSAVVAVLLGPAVPGGGSRPPVSGSTASAAGQSPQVTSRISRPPGTRSSPDVTTANAALIVTTS
jgi:hypothetical protein